MKKLRNYPMIMRLLVNLFAVSMAVILFVGLDHLFSFRAAVVIAGTAFIYIFVIANFILTYHLNDQSQG